MKKTLSLLITTCALIISLFGGNVTAQNIAIIESESYNAGHVMDNVWQNVATGMGMNATIFPQSTLYDTTFFSGADALIVSSGVITLTNSQITTITEFMQTGKSLYLQGEYDCTAYNTNTTFENLVNNNGGNFTLNGIISGVLAPMNVSGTLSTTPNVVSPLSYFWYGCRGNACGNVEPFLEYNGDYFGFIFCPTQSTDGRIVYTTDQDWVNQSTSLPLMANILTLITSNNYQCSGPNYLSANLGADTTICSDSSLVLIGGGSAFTYAWSTGATDSTITVNNAGVYWVTVSNGGCSVSDTIVVSETPCNSSPLSFSASDTFLCEKFCINFFDSSSNNPIAWHWLFEGGSPAFSTDQNPTNVCYDVPGVYDVTLITSTANGNDTLTLPNFITVNPTPPAPTISQNGYTLTSSFANTYQWQFNTVNIPGATNQSYTVMQTGLYTVLVGDSNSCKNLFTLYVQITGVDEVGGDANVIISPNPSDGNFMIELLNCLPGEEIFAEVTNDLGQIVFSSEESRPNGSADWKQQIDLSEMTRGVYFIEVKTKQYDVKKKIILIQ